MKMVNLDLYNDRQASYLEQTRQYEVESMQNQIAYEFKSNPSYEQITYLTESRDVHIVDRDKNFTKFGGYKKMLAYPNDVYNVGEYITLYGNTWMILSKDEDSKVQEKCNVVKCTNVAKWYDEVGILHEYPITIEKSFMYDMKSDKYITLPDREIRILIKYDQITTKIKWADVNSVEDKFTRFIFNGEPFRVTGSDKQSFIENGIGYIDLRLARDMQNPSDNLIDNIADDNKIITLLIQNGSTLNLGEGQSVQINSEVTLNDVVLVNPIIAYTSSNVNIATVNSSGLVTAIASGSVNITATYSTASDSIGITVSAVVADNYTVDIVSSNGIIDGIKLGQSLTFTSVSKNNGLPYAIVGTWNVLKDDGVTPMDSGIITVLSNVGNVLSLKCSSNSANVGTYFKVRYQDANASEIIRIRINSIF